MSTIAATNSLFEIDAELDSLLDEIEEQTAQGGEPSGELVARFQQFCSAHDEKVDRIGRFLRQMEAREQFCRSEAARLSDRARAAAGKVERTKNMVLYYLMSRDLKAIEGREFTLRAQKNSQDSVRITDEAALPVAFRRIDARISGVLWETVLANLPDETKAAMPGTSDTSARRCAASNTIENAWSVSPAASRQRTRPGDIPPRLQDPCGQAIEPWHLFRPVRLQLGAQHLGQQRVIPPGVPARPGRHHELQVGLHLPEHVRAVAALRQRVAQLAVQHVGDRGPQQELRQLGRGAVEQLVSEQIGDHRGPPGELGHRGRDVAVLEPGGGQPQAGHPALGVTPERLDLTGSQAVLAERGEQLGGLGQRQRQVALADLGQPAPPPPPADRQVGVHPAGQQKLRGPGEVLDHEAEILDDLRALQVMYVLQHDDQRILHGRPRGQQPVQELRRQPVHVSCRRRAGEGTRDRARQGHDEREPETLRPVIVGVQRHPFPGDRAQGPEPLCDGHGLPGGRTTGHQRHPPIRLGQNRAEARTRNRPNRDRRTPELRTRNRKRAAPGDGPRARADHI